MKSSFLERSIVVGLIMTSIPMTVWGAALNNNTNIPDAGSLLNELEPERHINPNPQRPQIDVKVPESKQPHQDLTVLVRKVVFDCQELDINTSLQSVVAGKLNKELTFEEMQQIALEATEALRKQGYMTAIVYIPAQDMQNSVLHMKAMIGHYGDVNIKNKSSMTDERVLGYTYNTRPGRLIKSQNLDKEILILNDIPGLSAKAFLAPGKKPGTAAINIEVTDLERQGGAVYVDNHGSKSTGKWRYGVNYHYDNLTKVGDQIEVNYLSSFANDMHNYLVRYNLPIGRDGAVAHVGASHMNYSLGDQWEYLGSVGTANTYELGVTVPMKRSLFHASTYDVSYRYRTLNDSWGNYALETNKSSHSINMEVNGYTRSIKDALSYSISHSVGTLGMDNDLAKAWDTLGTEGGWAKSNATLYHIHSFDKRWNLHTSASGQYGWDNLDSSESFYVGGASGVRAFPSGEAGGNSGLLGTMELRYQTGLPELQLAAFVDGGRVWYNHEPAAGNAENVRNLAGVGLGVLYNKNRDWYARFDWATPLGSKRSISNGGDVHNTFWLRVVKQF